MRWTKEGRHNNKEEIENNLIKDSSLVQHNIICFREVSVNSWVQGMATKVHFGEVEGQKGAENDLWEM